MEQTTKIMEYTGNNNCLQNPTEYKLTEKESIILQLLLNPELRLKNVSEICKLANCTRSTYYDAFAKPGFTAIYEQKTRELIKQSIGPVINTFVQKAKQGSFQHGKVILEMAGLYSEKSTLEVTGEVALIAEDRRARIAELLAKKQLDGAIPVDYKVIEDNSDMCHKPIVKSGADKKDD